MFKRGPYEGRLAFDSASGFHLDAQGRKVLTEDGGKSWRYAKRGDKSHLERYSENVLSFRGTNLDEHPEPHHHEVQPDDPHYDGLVFHPDPIAPQQTSHTGAWND